MILIVMIIISLFAGAIIAFVMASSDHQKAEQQELQNCEAKLGDIEK